MNNSRQAMKRRILVVANGTAEGAVLQEAIRDRLCGNEAEVLVLAPALGSRRHPWTSDEAEAWGDAEVRLRRCLDLLDRAGIEANGIVGDADPLQAIADVLHGFPADELVIATLSEARSPWPSGEVHVVVDRPNGAAGIRRSLAA